MRGSPGFSVRQRTDLHARATYAGTLRLDHPPGGLRALCLETRMHTTAHRPLRRTLFATALCLAAATPALAQITFYEHDEFQGRSFTSQNTLPDLKRSGFNDLASSAVVRNGRWEICEDADFGGRCTVLRPGQYPALSTMGLNDKLSSVRSVNSSAKVDDGRYAPQPAVANDYRRRNQERLFQAPVSSARAVYGAPEQRCWMEREQVPAERSDNRVPGAVLGAVIGGILGHQVGGGSGRDIATVGGVVAGAAVGAKVAGRNRDAPSTASRDVQRCADTPASAAPT